MTYWVRYTVHMNGVGNGHKHMECGPYETEARAELERYDIAGYAGVAGVAVIKRDEPMGPYTLREEA